MLAPVQFGLLQFDYAPAIRMGVPGANPHAGLGEFFTLPIFTCAGLMWMASAIDFVMIFVSLELVTMSFYVLVSFTRRNPATLEAGVKYLILSALSTGFLGLRHHLDFRRDRRDESCPHRDRAGDAGYRSASRSSSASRSCWSRSVSRSRRCRSRSGCRMFIKARRRP